MRILVTGGAGFIGFHASRMLLARGHSILAVDELNDYYSTRLKYARLAQLEPNAEFRFQKLDLADAEALNAVGASERFDAVLHLAAQAGVRYASENPAAYTRSNLVGHQNVLEFVRPQPKPIHLVYASSSSVYGNDTPAPFREDACADRPLSFYGATKRACELMSFSYASLYGLQQTGLRFFTVYGRFGRPDMAYWTFTDAILRGAPLPVYGEGKLRRDFTHVDDIVAGIVAILETPFSPATVPPHRVYNLGNNHPVEVLELIRFIEEGTERKADLRFVEGPPGDVAQTFADIKRAASDFGFAPRTALSDGISDFVKWFRDFHSL